MSRTSCLHLNDEDQMRDVDCGNRLDHDESWHTYFEDRREERTQRIKKTRDI